MISVIVPVYNSKMYLSRCFDSILAQTYEQFELLIINDGSTDGGGEICDSYEKKDCRIKVFHTDNKGVSAARNLGLNHAVGDYISFVDSDDWIEPFFFEALVKKAKETNADVVECGWFNEYPNKTVEKKKNDVILSGKEAVRALLHGQMLTFLWNKLWRRQLFDQIRFPEGRIYEDTAVVYKIMALVDCVATIDTSAYHYSFRENSICHITSMTNLADSWLSNLERFDYLIGTADETMKQDLFRTCAFAASRTWAYYYDSTVEDRVAYRDLIRDMNSFIKNNVPLFGYRGWRKWERIAVFFPHFNNALSFWMARLLNRIHRKKRFSNG